MERDTEIDNLRRENKVLEARVNQLQTGLAENKKTKTAANRSIGKNETILNRNDEYEVEDLLDDDDDDPERQAFFFWSNGKDTTGNITHRSGSLI